MPDKKKENRAELDRISDYIGDMYLMEMFWDMFDDLSIANQKKYIERAKRIVKEHGMEVDK